MKKAISIIILCILYGAIAPGGCGNPEEEISVEPEYADSVVETAVTSLCDGDYDKHLSVFTEEFAELLTEAGFLEGHNTITGKIGSYVSKTYHHTEKEDGYTIVYYQAEFTGETVLVEIRAVFQNEGGEMKLAGFWLISPKLLE